MRHRTLSWAILLGLGVGPSLATGCNRGPALSDEDRLARQDDTGEAKQAPPQEVQLFPDTGLGPKVREHIMILALPAENPEEADRRYAVSLAELRKSPKEAVDLLSAAYRNIQPARYYDRWALVKAMADLEVPGAYAMLASIARAPLPPEQNKDVHLFATQEDEVMIRLRAVEGLGRLAAKGQKAAEADLLALATERPSPNLAILARAIKAYLGAGKDYETRTQLLKSRLPPERHGLVTLDVTPQAEFEKRVSALATVSDSNTARDATEESLPASGTPKVPPTKRTAP